MRGYNQKLAERLKLIGIDGIDEIPYSIISIYNEEGIKAMSLFDNSLNYTIELAIPLKYLVLTINQQRKFSYNIKINGAAFNGKVQAIESSQGTLLLYTGADGKNYTISVGEQSLSLAYSTDFSGEYVLI